MTSAIHDTYRSSIHCSYRLVRASVRGKNLSYPQIRR